VVDAVVVVPSVGSVVCLCGRVGTIIARGLGVDTSGTVWVNSRSLGVIVVGAISVSVVCSAVTSCVDVASSGVDSMPGVVTSGVGVVIPGVLLSSVGVVGSCVDVLVVVVGVVISFVNPASVLVICDGNTTVEEYIKHIK
jgi:hypothetical protein